MGGLKKFLLENTGTRQTAAKNALWLSIGKIGSKLLRAVVVILAARKLGTSGYGVFSYVLSVAAFFTVFSDLGISQVLTREASQAPQKIKKYLTTSLWIKLSLIVTTGFIIIFAVPSFSKIEEAIPLLPLALALVFFDGIRDLLIALFRGIERMEKEALVTLVTNGVITILGLVVLFLFATPQNLTVVYIIGAGVGAMLGWYMLKDKLKGCRKNFSKNLVKPIISSAWPVALIGTFGAFMLNIDILLMGYFLDSSDVGLYSAAQKPVQMLYIVPAILAATLFPIFSRFAKNNKEKLRLVMGKGITTSLLAALPIAIGGAMLAPEIIRLLYGVEYAASSFVFQLLILTTLLVFPGMVLSNYLLAQDEHKRLAPVVVGSLIVNIGLDILLIPSLGIVGCAIATIIVSILYNGAAWMLAKKSNNFYTLHRLQKIFFSTAVMGSVVLLAKVLSLPVLLNIVLAGAVYFALLYLLKEETLSEIKKSLPI